MREQDDDQTKINLLCLLIKNLDAVPAPMPRYLHLILQMILN